MEAWPLAGRKNTAIFFDDGGSDGDKDWSVHLLSAERREKATQLDL
jgi:hypothetical protein